MNCLDICQRLSSNDFYGWTKPQTALMLVPGLSFFIQKLQLAEVLPLGPFQNNDEFFEKNKRFSDICKWNLRGSLIQAVVAVVAFAVFSNYIFLFFTILAIFQFVDISIPALQNNVYKQLPDGTEMYSAFNLF